MKDPLLICNDDGIQMIHHCPLGGAEQAVRDWVDFFLQDCQVDIFAFCTARPDKTHHESDVGERDFTTLDMAPSQSQRHYKQILDEFRDAGTDILRVVADQVRRRGKRVLASVRMSDVHHSSTLYEFLTPQFMRDHPEWRIRLADGSPDVAMDYAYEGVHEHRLAIFAELAENYDIDGLELDFMRSCRYFAAKEAASNCGILTEFVGRIRDMLDRVARNAVATHSSWGANSPKSCGVPRAGPGSRCLDIGRLDRLCRAVRFHVAGLRHEGGGFFRPVRRVRLWRVPLPESVRSRMGRSSRHQQLYH